MKIGFPLGMAGGVIFGALIDNMAIGILLGLAVGCGVITFRRGKTEDEAQP